jgi:hypothetical protein
MSLKLQGIDHIYLSVKAMDESEACYDRVMEALGLHKVDTPVAGEHHAYHVAPTFQVTIPSSRSARTNAPFAPGLSLSAV